MMVVVNTIVFKHQQDFEGSKHDLGRTEILQLTKCFPTMVLSNPLLNSTNVDLARLWSIVL